MKNDKVVLAALKRAAKEQTQSKLAKKWNVTLQYLNDVIHERRHISKEIAGKLGFEAVWQEKRKHVGKGQK